MARHSPPPSSAPESATRDAASRGRPGLSVVGGATGNRGETSGKAARGGGEEQLEPNPGRAWSRPYGDFTPAAAWVEGHASVSRNETLPVHDLPVKIFLVHRMGREAGLLPP